MGRLVRVAVVLYIALTVLAACSQPGVTVSNGPQQTTIIGRLGGDAGCAWLETTTGQKVEVVYPNGWHIEFSPVALFDETGRQVANGGDTLEVEGYFNDVGASVCNPQRSFNATKVAVRR